MTIAAHIADTVPGNKTSSGFIYSCCCRLAAKYPGDHFIFIFDKPFDPSLIKEKNITPVLAGPAIRNRMLQYYFYNFKIPRLLTKYNATCFVSAEVCSLRAAVPQLYILNDLSFLKKNRLLSGTDRRYLKKYLKFFVKRSAAVAAMNPSLVAELSQLFPQAAGKIKYLQPGIDTDFTGISFEQAEQVRNKYTNGKNYFLFFSTAATSANSIVLLKAFSIFKKWQKSNMQLVILGKGNELPEIKELSSYKYRNDVLTLLPDNANEWAAIIAAAYAGLYIPAVDVTSPEGLECIGCNIPLITTNNEFNRQLYKNAALYCSPTEQAIAENMMLVYKDENARNALIDEGKIIIEQHQWDTVADELMSNIQSLPAFKL